MTVPSYEPFIRICQRCLINIDGTSPHSSNHACPLPSFFLHLLTCPSSLSLLPPCAYFLHHVSRSLHPLSFIIAHILTPSTDTVPIKSQRCLSSSLPSFFLPPTNTCILAPHPTPLLYPYLFLTLSLTPVTHPLSRLFPLLTCMFSVISRFAFLCR